MKRMDEEKLKDMSAVLKMRLEFETLKLLL